MRKLKLILLFAAVVFTSAAQNMELEKSGSSFFGGIDYQVRANFSIGGSAPLGLPAEIRSVERYNPTSALGLEANATKWLTDDNLWGIRVGLRVDDKGMKTLAKVKSYRTEIQYEKVLIGGYFTGLVETNVRNTYATLPVSAVRKMGENWLLTGGLYFSYAIDRMFDGYVSDGYLRQGTPTGEKMTFENGAQASYDFSDEVNKFQWGAQVGAEWYLKKHFVLFPELTYGFNGVLNPDFKAISFTMHNIYLNLGFGYRF